MKISRAAMIISRDGREYAIACEPDENGVWCCKAMGWTGLIGDGDDLMMAVESLYEAIPTWLEHAKENGLV